MALIAWAMEETEIAENYFIISLDLDPENSKCLVDYGKMLTQCEKYDEAKKHLDMAVKRFPKNPQIYSCFGRIFFA